MSTLARIVKNPYLWIVVGVVAAVALVVALGAWLEWALAVRLAAVAAVLAVCTVGLIAGFVRAHRRAARIEQSIQARAEQQRLSTRPDRRTDVEQLQRRLGTAIDTLKRSKLGRGGRGRAALYALPWYLMIGPPGAGKTSAIGHSGLTFPLGAERVRGVGGTRNCDWFFSDQAILLDTAGRYMTEHEDTEEWLAFLDMLKKHRPRQPINGVVVGISVADLAGASDDDVEWHATRIRRRIDELIERLGVRFPVYLVFTKCDLLQGFVQCFGDLARPERERAWGATLAEDLEPGTHLDAFEREFAVLHERLAAFRIDRLVQLDDAGQREQTYLFVEEFAALEGPLGRFVWWLFQPNPYQESPIFRGFYFTSGTQEGTPLDRASRPVAEAFELPADAPPAHDPGGETRGYFLRALFTDVLVPDRHLVRTTRPASRRQRLVRAGTGLAALLLLVLFVTGAARALVYGVHEVQAVREASQHLDSLRWDAGVPLTAALHGMAQLRTRTDALVDRTGAPSRAWGLHQEAAVREPARRLYESAARSVVAARPWRALRHRLQEAGAAGPPGRRAAGSRDTLYADLKAYMLLTSEVARLDEAASRDFLHEHLTRAYLWDAEGRGDLRRQVTAPVKGVVQGLRAGRVEPFEGDPALVDRVRALIYEPPSVERLYEQIEAEGKARYPEVTLTDALDGRSARPFASRPTVPGLFTRAAWSGFVKDAIAAQTRAPDQVDWVMGYTLDDLPASMRSQERVAEDLRALYDDAYAAAWDHFLGELRLHGFASPRDAAHGLSELGSSYDSPLLYVLARVSQETQLGGSMLDEVRGRLEEQAVREAERQARRRVGRAARAPSGDEETGETPSHSVDRHFRWLHELEPGKARSGGGAPELLRALRALDHLSESVGGLAGAEAASLAADVVRSDGGAMEEAVQAVRDALPRMDRRVREALFEAPVTAAWGAVLEESQRYLNERWRDAVCRPYREQLAGRYPFAPEAEQEASLEAVARYFAPREGRVQAFFAEHLEPFVVPDERRVETWRTRGVRVAPAAWDALERARRLAETLHDGEILQVAFELQPEQPVVAEGAPPVSQVYAALHGRELTYRMGSYRPWVPFAWPGEDGVLLRITTQAGDLSPQRLDGDWAWFRLMDRAQVQRRSATQYEVRWAFDRGVTARYHLRTEAADLFVAPTLFTRFACPGQLG